MLAQVQRISGFAPGLFTGAETDAKALQVSVMCAAAGASVLSPQAEPPQVVQDKAAKLGYLQKAFAAVQAATGKQVVADPAKVHTAALPFGLHSCSSQTATWLQVLAGLEPEHTNSFLQLLAEAGRAARDPAPAPRSEPPAERAASAQPAAKKAAAGKPAAKAPVFERLTPQHQVVHEYQAPLKAASSLEPPAAAGV